jgi:hypothetical protein
LAKQFSDRTNFESVPMIPEEVETSASPEGKGGLEPGSNHTTLSRFMPTSRRIVQFSDGVPAPPGARIVYIDGAFDMFHPGHIDILKVGLFPSHIDSFYHIPFMFSSLKSKAG